jgi:starch synthase
MIDTRDGDSPGRQPRVLVACPDARPPAYHAVIALNQAGWLESFATAYFFNPGSRSVILARRLAPRHFQRWEALLRRRHHPEIPADRVVRVPSVDLALRLEASLASRRTNLKRRLAQARTDWFDRRLASLVARVRPDLLLVFSDVGSERTLPLCRRLGIPTILSMVHGDVREEARILAEEEAAAPDFFPLYLGDGVLDREELRWLHQRRLRDLELADRILVPSTQIAETLTAHGTPIDKIQVVPYAADCRRFQPPPRKQHGSNCTFLFAGGITQRKGIKYLLEAWEKVRRPEWKLQLLGPLPHRCGPLEPWLGHVELLGRVGHAEVPGRMAAADVFVFPSLFEGSAVVTYEALAAGLPCVVSPSAGSVVRDGVEGFLVPPRNVEELAARMIQLGNSPDLRARMSQAARRRAREFDWPRYHAAILREAATLLHHPQPTWTADGPGPNCAEPTATDPSRLNTGWENPEATSGVEPAAEASRLPDPEATAGKPVWPQRQRRLRESVADRRFGNQAGVAPDPSTATSRKA